VTEREIWVEVYRGLGHIMKGLGTITAAIARRYALGERETAARPSERR
jgi:hypothetical protein